MQREINENLTDICTQVTQAEQYLTEAAALIVGQYQSELNRIYISPPERNARHLLLFARLAQIEQCNNKILYAIKDIAKAEMIRIFNEHTNGAYKEQAPQAVEVIFEQMHREGRI